MKYRAWDKQLNCFTKEAALSPSGRVLTWDWHLDDGKSWGYDTLDNNRYVFQLSTGSKDKEGREIYEGDILKCVGRGVFFREDLIGNVVFNEFEYCILTNDDKWPLASFAVLSDKEIIGNIFENPELKV